MTSYSFKRSACSLLLLVLFAPLLHADSQLLDQVAAVVNDEVITQSEVDTFLRPLYEEYKKQYPQEQLVQMMGEARQKLLNQLVEDRLAYQEAKTQKIEVDEAAIDQDLDQFKKRFKNDKELEGLMQREGLSMNEMRERARRQAMIRQLQDKEIRSRVVVSPLEVEAYYKEHAEEFSGADQIRIRSLTIKKDDVAREKGLKDETAKSKIEDLRKQILSGENFGEIAKKFSQDTNAEKEGMGDWMQRGSMIPIIDEVIFNLKQGDVSQVVESPMGYHLFRVEEKKEKYKKSLDEARDEIYGKIFQKKSRERFDDWMKELKRNAYISVH
jgi:peptidyl-prolyl cis-trans isomerase SurA